MHVAIDGLLLGRNYTGVEHSVEALAAALPAAAPAHRYTLFCTPGYDGGRLGLTTVQAPGWVRGRALRILYEQHGLARAAAGCDLLHAPAYVMPLTWRGPSVLTVYDLIALDFPDWCKRSNAWHYGYMLPRSLARATTVVVPCETVAAAVRRRYPRCADKVRVVPLGVDEAYRPATAQQVAELREQLGLPEHFILYVGNFEPKKNLPALIEAFDLVADELPHHLVLRGRPAWGYEATLRAWRRCRHPERVHRLDYLPPERLGFLYSAADLLVQWSLYEGFGLPPLEAMACGTPVLVSSGGALPEIAGPAAQVVPLGPAVRLAAGLRGLLTAPAQLAELRARGLRHVAQFTWTAHARAVAALYEDTLNA